MGTIAEKELQEVEEGLGRWHVCSPDVARRLIAEIRRLDAALAFTAEHLSVAQKRVDEARGRLVAPPHGSAESK